MRSIIIDIPRIYTAVAEWIMCLCFILNIQKRTNKIVLNTVASVFFLFMQVAFMVLTANVTEFLWIPAMTVALIIMTLYIYAVCNISIYDSLYYGLIAFLIAEFAASLEWQLARYFNVGILQPFRVVPIVFGISVYFVVVATLFFLIRRRLINEGALNIQLTELLTAVFTTVVIFDFSNLSFLALRTPFSGSYANEISNIRTLVDFGGVAVMLSHLAQCSQRRAREELEAVENLLQNQYVQYQISKETIDLINFKYHDLKHQLHILRRERDPNKKDEYLDQMEQDIKFYEASNKTGNNVLDTILTSKNMTCDQNDITFTVVADGSLLNFMETMDLCSIFGNALDNAIECEKNIEDKEKRLIHVTVSQKKKFVMIKFENYYEGDINIRQGNILTTKSDEKFHGYGIKSIRYTVSKYGGALHINNDNNWFELQVLLPIS